ncbi:PREDICTED: uncharacterized protein LOC106303189 [Brassica oleracea var. oleracea]|uniref:uncharacterized protein LOC106303189 n=1 Tax=Brassica oleracea var. oleracea TaxID=109376 RepID=UPI0006A6DE47|nr:PREDICTED: uncharacterized protein LOC106303189 [Brassica oleracea var. oleracea]
MTPYNLPPEMCMKQEYMFLTVLVPGPNHPKRSLDIFLQPLIDELKDLWSNGVQAFDISTKQNFLLQAVLMWTISDFPAYGMLSGWTTHGRLACPYCMDETNAFQLKNGRKTSEELWQSVNGLPKTVDCEGNHRRLQGYGDTHNWHKQSIFWELPYWKSHKLLHNLDVMHIEKNFWDNIINTLLNVQGKTKDDIKSRLDLKEYCNRKELHLTSDGKAPVPIFRLQADEKKTFLQWLKEDVKFSDGYASSISGCVDLSGGKLTGMKSHDCHVLMQRLLPIAFAELLDKSVHEALSSVSSFFRDISARTLHKDGVAMLHRNISMVLCNLEKIFPPSFFNVMEHLPIHLPHEAQLGGPVQFRWMYPFERYMYHLKKKIKNKAKVEGSIVEQYVNEEISTFCSHYFESHIKTKSRTEDRHYDGGDDQYTHQLGDVPDMFYQHGRSSGKAKDIWLQTKDFHHAHTYVLLNCEQLRPFERLFDERMIADHPDISDNNLIKLKEKDFANWLLKHVEDNCADKSYPNWLQSLAHGPMGTVSSGLSDEPDFYGIIRDIIELHYHGPVELKVVVFFCDWYDSTSGRGIRRNKSGIIDVNVTKRYGKYDPFILASQADQVCYVPYPRVTRKREQQWEAAIVIQPRGKVLVDGNLDFTAMQSENDSPIINVDSVEVETLTNLHGQVEDLDDVNVNDESGSDDEDGNSDIEVTDEDSE